MSATAALSASAASAAAAASEPVSLGVAAGLMGLAVVLLVIEFLTVIMGVFTIGAAICAFAACAIAFSHSLAAGWAFLVAVPILAGGVLAFGFQWLRRTRAAVPTTEITADAGYHLVAEQLGLAPGAIGELVTPARPTGRARFATAKGSGECDVAVRGGVCERGDRVVVLAIAGAVVDVAPAPSPTP